MATRVGMPRRLALGAAGVGAAGMLALAGAAPVGGAAAPVLSHALWRGQRGTSSTWSSSNWSGYAETGSFDGVSATWTVPSVSATPTATYSSAWIGVDGFNDSSLIQTGTEQDYYSGSAHYNAWWEILPAAETPLPSGYPIGPGDVMSAQIYKTSATQIVGGGRGGASSTQPLSASGRNARPGGHHGGGGGGKSEPVWVISITDQTRNWTFTTDQAYSGPGTSAEWIVEAPEVNGRIATLAHYTMAPTPQGGDFDQAEVTAAVTTAGTAPTTFTGAGLDYTADAGTLVQNSLTVSSPSKPDGAATAFDMAYGATAPPAPSS